MNYTACIAPVRILNCPAVVFGRHYIVRVSRPKDRVDFTTPTVVCRTPGMLDITRFRHSDNRGAQRPLFIVPIKVKFEDKTSKRTVLITVEERNLQTTALTVVATAAVDLIRLVDDVFAAVGGGQIRSSCDFSIPMQTVEDDERTLGFHGRACTCQADVLMYPSDAGEPAWPEPPILTVPISALLSSRQQSTAAARQRRIQRERELILARERQQQQQQQSLSSPPSPSATKMTPQVQRRINAVLDSLQQIEDLKHSVEELAAEIAELEAKEQLRLASSHQQHARKSEVVASVVNDNDVAAAATAMFTPRHYSPAAPAVAAAASSTPRVVSRRIVNDDDDDDGAADVDLDTDVHRGSSNNNGTTAIPAATTMPIFPNDETRTSLPQLAALLSSIDDQAVMFADDALQRWGNFDGEFRLAVSTTNAKKPPPPQDLLILFHDRAAKLPPPNPCLSSAVAEIFSDQHHPDVSAGDNSIAAMRNLCALDCLEQMSKHLEALAVTGDPWSDAVQLPSVDEIAQSLLARVA